MRYLFGFMCVLGLGLMGCSETTGTGGSGGIAGSGGVGGDSGNGGVGGDCAAYPEGIGQDCATEDFDGWCVKGVCWPYDCSELEQRFEDRGLSLRCELACHRAASLWGWVLTVLHELFEPLRHHNDGKIFHLLITYMTDRKTHRARWVSALQDSVVSVDLINGSVDPVSGAHMVARYREIVSKDRFIVELPTIGHHPQVEAPREVVDAYSRFLAELR